MTDEMDHTPDDWLPDSADDATGTGAGDLPSFEEALRAHGFEVEPPKLDDPGVVGPETSDDGELPVDDDSTAPVLADARAGGALGATGGAESSLAALAASWIPRSSVAPPPARARGSVFRSVLVRPPMASAPWVTAPEAQGAPGIEDAAPAEAAVEAPVAPPAGRLDVPDDLEDVHEPNLPDALAAAPDEAPARTEGEAGVVEMTTMKVTEARDLAEPEDPLAARRRARRRRKDNAAAAKAAAAAAIPAAAASESLTDVEPTWTAGEAGVVEMTNDEVTEAWDTSAPRAGSGDEVEEQWWIEPGAAAEDSAEGASPKLPRPPATLAEPRPPVPSASLFASHLGSAQAGTAEPDAAATAEKVAGAEFVGYDAVAAARAAAAAEALAHPPTERPEETPEPMSGPAEPPADEAPLDEFEARLRAANEPLGYVAPSDEQPEDAATGTTSEWSSSAASWEELHDDPWAAQAVADRVAPPHERESFTYEAPAATPADAEAPATEPAEETETPSESGGVAEASAVSPVLESVTEPVASGSPTPAADAETAEASEAETAEASEAETADATDAEEAAATADATDAEEDAATAGRTPVAPSGLSLPPGPPSLLRAKKKKAASQEPGVFERASARTAEPVLGTVQATDATAGSIETHSATAERGDLWHLVSDKMESRAAAAPTAPDRITILLTVLVAFVIVVLVVGFIALFTNFFH